jgi:hypothetical protein
MATREAATAPTGPFVTDFTGIEQAFSDVLETVDSYVLKVVLIHWIGYQGQARPELPPEPAAPEPQTTEQLLDPATWPVNSAGQPINPVTGEPGEVPVPDDIFIP